MDFLNNFDLKNIFNEYKDMLFKSKKYWLIYLVLIFVLGLSTINKKNFIHPQFVILTFILVAILGIFCIVFYFLHDSDEELYKVGFVIILCFGIVCALIVPICDVSDETEHFTRAEITSRGILIPHWTGEDLGVSGLFNRTGGQTYSTERNDGAGFYTINSTKFFSKNLGFTVFETDDDTDKISHTLYLTESAFEQNPFFGYLPQALGIVIAKFLDLNVIWMLWLARICNLLFYAGVISFAIKKTPVLKLPLLVIACIPICIYQAASVSIDCMIISLGLLAISYFIYMCYAKEKSITVKEIAIFTVICILLGLCKLTYLAFIFLLLIVPRRNFNFSNVILSYLSSISIVSIIGVLWSRYSTPALMHSWRSKLNYMNSSAQIDYMMHHPVFVKNFLTQIFTIDLGSMMYGVFNFFYAASAYHYSDRYYLIVALILLFLTLILIFYPEKNKFSLKTRIT